MAGKPRRLKAKAGVYDHPIRRWEYVLHKPTRLGIKSYMYEDGIGDFVFCLNTVPEWGALGKVMECRNRKSGETYTIWEPSRSKDIGWNEVGFKYYPEQLRKKLREGKVELRLHKPFPTYR